MFQNNKNYIRGQCHHGIYDSRVSSWIIFPCWVAVDILKNWLSYLMFSLRFRQSDIAVIVDHRSQWHRPAAKLLPASWTLVAKFTDLGNDMTSGDNEKFEMTLMGLSVAWVKMIHEKTWVSNISWHYPFNSTVAVSKKALNKHLYTKYNKLYGCKLNLIMCFFIWVCARVLN